MKLPSDELAWTLDLELGEGTGRAKAKSRQKPGQACPSFQLLLLGPVTQRFVRPGTCPPGAHHQAEEPEISTTC